MWGWRVIVSPLYAVMPGIGGTAFGTHQGIFCALCFNVSYIDYNG